MRPIQGQTSVGYVSILLGLKVAQNVFYRVLRAHAFQVTFPVT